MALAAAVVSLNMVAAFASESGDDVSTQPVEQPREDQPAQE